MQPRLGGEVVREGVGRHVDSSAQKQQERAEVQRDLQEASVKGRPAGLDVI